MTDIDVFTRRQFINHGLALVSAGVTIPSFLHGTALALSDPAITSGSRRSKDHRILVIVQLAGGNDGLNTVVPFTNDNYYRLRPTLAIKKDEVLKLDRDLGLHPSATGLKALFDDGHLAIVRGVGYPNPDRSHFKSTDIWHTASPDGRKHDGWIGRYFDHECAGSDPIDPTQALALVEEAPLTLRGAKFLPIAFDKPERLSLKGLGGDKTTAEVIEKLNRPRPEDAEPRNSFRRTGDQPRQSTLDFLRRTALDAQLSAGDIRSAANEPRGSVKFPNNGLGQSLETVHRLIAAGLPTRVYYASLSGFDTHANQLGRQAGLLADLGSSLQAFVAALKESGDLDRVLLMTFSEFGRRVAQNASGGTDHGAAAPLFLAGGKVKPGLQGRSPSLDPLVDGDLAFTTDFRQVYATIIKKWLSADSAKILGPGYPTLPLLQG